MTDSPQPQIDLTKIDFPSDQVTFKLLRRIYSSYFDQQDDRSWIFNHVEATELEPLVNIEGRLATKAFDDMLGRTTTSRHPGFWEEQREDLTAIYITLGLASGPQHAEQLIRTFEQTAAEQARRHMPRTPPR